METLAIGISSMVELGQMAVISYLVLVVCGTLAFFMLSSLTTAPSRSRAAKPSTQKARRKALGMVSLEDYIQ